MGLTSKVALILDKTSLVSRWSHMVGVGILFLMACVTFADVLLRYIFSRPLTGTTEVTELMLVMVVYLGIAHTHYKKGHVAVDVIIDRLRPKARLVMDTIITVFSVGVFFILAWQSSREFLWVLETGAQHSHYLYTPKVPSMVAMFFGCTMVSLLLLRDLFSNVAEGLRLHLNGQLWLLMFGIPFLVLVLAIPWMQPGLWHLNLATVAVIGLIFSLLFFFLGMPISFVLVMISILFIAHIRGLQVAFDIVGVELFRTTASYIWAAVAFFVLMGYFSLVAGFGRDLYYVTYKWLGHIHGGLTSAIIAACTAFSSMVGDALSSIITIGAVSLPEAKRYHYDNRLSVGAIAAGAIIGPLIPPSITFIFYGALTGMSIGKLFIAGIIPGLLLSGAFVLTSYIWCRSQPGIGPPGERIAWRERIVSLKLVGPVALLFLLVVGGIYAGVFTPSEGGGIGATCVVLIGLAMRRFTWQKFNSALLEAGKVISMLFLIIVGATMFARFAVLCNLPELVRESVATLNLAPAGIIITFLLAFFILGFFINVSALVLIGVPIVHPIAVGIGVDPIWFAVLLVMVVNVGMITPPVGAVLFALKGVAKDVSIGAIYAGVIPFILATVVVVCLIFILPPLATWLPSIL